MPPCLLTVRRYAGVVRLSDPVGEGSHGGEALRGTQGSGKTFTMGTGVISDMAPENVGVIPRAVQHIFDSAQARSVRVNVCAVVIAVFLVSAWASLSREQFVR